MISFTYMSPSGSNIPSQPRGPQQPRITQEGGRESVESVKPDAGKQQQAQKDQFSKQGLNKVLRQMKQMVSEKGKGFQAGRMLAGKTTGPLGVLTEELRAEMRAAVQTAKDGDFTDFEKVFLEYFMGEKSLGVLLAAGEKKYRKKQLQQWKEFFEQLYSYIQEKSADAESIRELIFRGISNQDPRPDDPKAQSGKPVLIADLYIKRERRDRCEKFVRLEIPTTEALNTLRNLEPGAVISVETLVQCFGSDDIPYLCLYYRPVREGALTAQGHPAARHMARHAGAAAQATEAMYSGGLDVSSKAANLAEHHVKGKGDEKLKETKEAGTDNELYKQKNLLDKLLS